VQGFYGDPQHARDDDTRSRVCVDTSFYGGVSYERELRNDGARVSGVRLSCERPLADCMLPQDPVGPPLPREVVVVDLPLVNKGFGAKSQRPARYFVARSPVPEALTSAVVAFANERVNPWHLNNLRHLMYTIAAHDRAIVPARADGRSVCGLRLASPAVGDVGAQQTYCTSVCVSGRTKQRFQACHVCRNHLSNAFCLAMARCRDTPGDSETRLRAAVDFFVRACATYTFAVRAHAWPQKSSFNSSYPLALSTLRPDESLDTIDVARSYAMTQPLQNQRMQWYRTQSATRVVLPVAHPVPANLIPTRILCGGLDALIAAAVIDADAAPATLKAAASHQKRARVSSS